MYMIAQLDLNWGETQTFYEAMPKLKKVMEEYSPEGPRMLCAFSATFGHMFRLIHVWETPTADCFLKAIDHAIKDPAFPQIVAELKKACATEIIMFAEETPYSPGLIGK